MKQITITKVVSKNFFVDFIAKIQNFFGKNISGYEKMVDKGVEQINEELKQSDVKLEWYRYEISQLTNGAMVIMFYGDKK